MARTGAAVTEATRDRWFSQEMLRETVSWPARLGPAPRYRRDAGGGIRFETAGAGSGVSVDAVFGSGLRGSTPVAFAPGGRLRELRLSFSRAQQGWFPTPGGEEDRDPLGDLDGPEASADCLGCHATALARDDEARFDPHRAVLGVRCERCHGAGLAHVEAQVEARSGGGDAGSIFHPGRLSPRDQTAFCGQCHRQPTDFEPREILARDPGLARHAGASLMMSACFRESPPASTITCTECHDPHRAEPAGPERTRGVCRRCHEDAAARHRRTPISDGADCAGCHLPTERDAFHGTPFTDHWIRTSDEPPGPGTPRGQAELRWLEALYGERIPEDHRPEKAARLRAGLAELLHLRGARAEARALLREALGLGADYETRMKAGALLRDGGRAGEALAIFREAAAERPDRPHAFFELGDLLLESGDFSGAAAPLATAAELSPGSAGVQTRLGAALLGADRAEAAATAFRAALALDPDDPAALGALAGILAAPPRRDLRDPREAVALAERLARRSSFEEPYSLDLLGAALAAAGDFRGALEAGRRAATLATGTHAAAVRGRLALYEAGRAYIGPLPLGAAR